MTGDPAFEAREQVRLAVYRLTGGPGDPRHARYDPLAALRALTSLRAALAQPEREAARRAREDGIPWSRIGEELGFADDGAGGMTSVAERAFARFASDLGSGPSFAWTCKPLGDLAGCGNLISDHGPELGNPHDAERGHAEGCERFAAEVAEWRAYWNEGG